MMTEQEYFLTLAAEEAGELAEAALSFQKRVHKALRFSVDEVQPEQELSNGQRIAEEFIDLLAIIQKLEDEGVISFDNLSEGIAAKQEKVARFMERSKSNGVVT